MVERRMDVLTLDDSVYKNCLLHHTKKMNLACDSHWIIYGVNTSELWIMYKQYSIWAMHYISEY